MGSGKSWSTEETKSACHAYIAASEDPLSGYHKSKDVFFNQVKQHYDLLMKKYEGIDTVTTYPRSATAIVQRYKKGRCECIKFSGIVMKLEAKTLTGSPTEEDIYLIATAVYNDEANISNAYSFIQDKQLSCGKAFEFLHTLKIFEKTKQWAVMMEKKLRKKDNDINGVELESLNAKEMSEANVIRKRDKNDIEDRHESEEKTEEIQSSGEGIKRSKRAHYMDNQTKVLMKGANGIDEAAKASKERNKLARELLKVEKKKR